MGPFRWKVLLLLNVLLGVASAVTISGARGGVNHHTGERPARKDINRLQWSGPEWDLYIQALKAYQEEDRSHLLSYHQVAGIHGYPYKSWDGVEGLGGAGYCSHGSTLFPVWHRPYLAMYEERISRYAHAIANTYPPIIRGIYQKAASDLRIPYWDWASDPELPRSVITPELNINTPEGLRTVRNPLYDYAINPSAQEGFPIDSLSRYHRTVRNPDEQGVSQVEAIQRTLNANGALIRINTYQLLAGETNYTVFSTDALPDRHGSFNNLENIHGLIHNSVGGNGGHMTYTPWSAYDPIFWLHHTNVDRVVALWQAVHPESYVQPLPNRGGDFMKRPGTWEDAKTPFAPFRDPNNRFYNAETSRSMRPFGYTYPEIRDWGVTPEQLSRNVRMEINRLYNRPGDNNRKRSTALTARAAHHHGMIMHKRMPNLAEDTLDDLKKLNFKVKEFFEDLGKFSLLNFIKLGINNLEKQWVINIRANKFALPHAYNIHFFLSEPPEESCDWASAPNLIGTFASFASSMGSPANRTRDMYGQIPLSHVLAVVWDSKMILDLEDATILPLLEKHLEWRVQDLTGKVVDAGELIGSSTGHSCGLEITIAERDVTPLTGDEKERDHFPILGEWKMFKDITQKEKKKKQCKPKYKV
ncbi:polyphenol oxidase, variant [Blastomyces gilchristii SLH14081]|uniref:Polyphenol oxidase n=1 Tax=Blastomyces gilchristii (strain SLH14081) TaxID=559298 RepID=A0A179UBU9_BLAGS|nr:polyphenol oxidase [Blastomyces gilchristii SLH14081]XP_031576739.1 polyphenol oxidase, variant [Blastomyces gilchristii SLH14081]OAT05486.1 polyphenol oxidase [Blastomyces gilchristii SLH14081]OAT05487.1 polyphenol oxidase, variant [Blastomyces gilchristii SLH14081]